MKNEITNNKKLDLLWLRAAILGSIWASSEIILGSFLHNLRIPFSGTLLSALGVYLLTAFDVKWRHNGVIIRAGIICAIMKSFSPSSVIFGPMVAIIAESFLISSSTKLLGRNMLGYGVGGALAVSWSLFHKIINMVILYGSDIIKIYNNLYEYAAKITSFNLGSPSTLIIILFCFYGIAGFVVSVFGMLAGNKVVPMYFEITGNAKDNILGLKNKTIFANHSLVWLFLEICTVIFGLLVLSNLGFFYSLSFVLVVTTINLFKYKKFLSNQFKLKFWIGLALVTTLAGLFLGGMKNAAWEFSFNNLMDGFQITLRALLLTECFILIGIELTNPVVKNIFLKFNLGKLPIALDAAFQALPMMVSIMSSHKDKLRTPSALISGYVTVADNWILKHQTAIE